MTENTTASGAADRPEALKLASILRGLDTRHYFGNKKLVAAADELERLHALAASAPVAPTGWRLLKDSTTAERSWDEDTADGIYFNECVHCGRGFTGYKRRGVCKVCFSNPAPQAAPVAPAPQPATPKGFVLVPVEATEDMKAAAVKYANGTAVYKNVAVAALRIEEGIYGEVYEAMIAASPCLTCNDNGMIGGPSYYNPGEGGEPCPDCTPKAEPAINKVSDIIDAYGMKPGQPERVADIPGLAEALEAAFADGSAQITGAAPLQQGEYPGLPQGDVNTGVGEMWNRHSMRAYVDADRAARGAAQPGPVEVHDPKCPALIGDACACERHEPAVDKAWARFCGGIGDGPNAPYPGMIGAFERYYGQSFADKDWRSEASVWAAAWKARDNQPAATTQPAPVAEDAEIRKALDDAATALETIGRIAGRDRYMLGMMDVRLYAASRARVAREAQAAQPEGGA